jgi:hypothetical protein
MGLNKTIHILPLPHIKQAILLDILNPLRQ